MLHSLYMRTDHEGCPLRKNVQLVWPIIRRDNTTSTCFSLCTGTYHYPTVGLKRLYIFLSTSLLSYIPLTDSSWSNNHLWNTDVWCNHNICRFSHVFFLHLYFLYCMHNHGSYALQNLHQLQNIYGESIWSSEHRKSFLH